jgi:hypothetical protein
VTVFGSDAKRASVHTPATMKTAPRHAIDVGPGMRAVEPALFGRLPAREK